MRADVHLVPSPCAYEASTRSASQCHANRRAHTQPVWAAPAPQLAVCARAPKVPEVRSVGRRADDRGASAAIWLHLFYVEHAARA
eukprot:6208634-Pleurochrysis_carterae.AAC.1